jgi:hypothetical protein
MIYTIYTSMISIRTILFVVTNLLTPSYILLSLVAVASRCNNILKGLASHGKTISSDSALNSTDTTIKITVTNKLSSLSSLWSSWCWVSKRCFVHFYLVGLLSTAVATIYHLDCYLEKIPYHNIDTRVLGEIIVSKTASVVLLVIHLARRAYECLYIQQYREGSSKMHIAGYTLGVGHYMVLSLVFLDIDPTNSSVVVGSTSNSNVQDENHSYCSGSIYSATKMTTMMAIFIFGIISINLWLQYEQHRHHVILADIRRVAVDDETKNEDESNLRQNQHYSLPPYRRWFRYVFCPHYLAEILLYLSFAIILEIAAAAAVQNNSVCKNISSNNFEYLFFFGNMNDSLFVGRRYRHWMLFVWVAVNLTVSAMNSYDWYNSRYNDSTRKSDNPSTDSASRRLADNRNERKALLPKIL